GSEWNLNYRIFDPVEKIFLTEETTIGSNLNVEALNNVSVRIADLGGGGFSVDLSHDTPGSHQPLKYVEVVNTPSGYIAGDASVERPSLQKQGDNTGSTDLYWTAHDGSSYLVTEQNVGAFTSANLADGNIVFSYAVHLGSEWNLNYRIFDPVEKIFLTEETTIGSNLNVEALNNVSVRIADLGGGGFSVDLSHDTPGSHQPLKYVEVTREEGDVFSPIDQDATFSYQLTATDIDADVVSETLTFETVTVPDWMTVSSAGLITGTPTNDDVGDHGVTVKVTDTAGESDTKTFTLTVNNINDVPVFDFAPPSSTDEDAAFSYQLTASDIDADVAAETLTFEAVTVPDWMTVSSTGLITGIPTNGNVGDHSVTVKVTDIAGESDTRTFTLTVNNTNDAPIIDVGDTDGALADGIDGSAFSHQLSMTDVDVGDTHTYTMSSPDNISWLTLDGSTGLLTGAPDDEQVGVYNITFSITDAASEVSTSDTISLTVQNVNDPVYIGEGQTSLFRSETNNIYTVLISDEDLADSYTFTASGLPTWMSLDASTGVLSGTPTRADDGVYDISITVEDAGGLTDTRAIQITSTSYEFSILGLDDDFFFGDTDRDWIETGGGNDEVYAGGGDDIVVVQGEGDVQVDTGTGDDEVRVESGWSGTLLLKSDIGSNKLDIDQVVQSMEQVNETDLKITFTSGSEITIEDHYSIDEEGLYSVSSSGFQTINVEGIEGIENPYPEKEVSLTSGSESSDIIQAPSVVNEDVVNIVSTGGGDDTVYLGGGYNKAIGGTGVDTFHIASEAQNTKIYGDLNGNSSIYSNANATLNQDASGSTNTDFGDAVHLGWLKSEVTLS
ncbi:putative Ig domain-containing protein, partial [Alphaproteobacteria bacterium]|nr:putative Ig domain-containing protein [Alphaproteobacteria bacterium]